MAENVVLKLDNVSKSFAKVEKDEITHALGNINLEMRSGEFISLVGTSGCGKSTILRLIAGLITPTMGRLTVNDQEITGPDPERGMVFQRPTLFPWLTVEKNIAFSLKMQNKLKGNEDKVERMLRLIGLEDFKDDYPGQLSGGMAQRVALVRSLINEPPILLLDEPLGALDAFTRMNNSVRMERAQAACHHGHPRCRRSHLHGHPRHCHGGKSGSHQSRYSAYNGLSPQPKQFTVCCVS